MLKTVGVTELQRQFRSIFEDVISGNVPYVLTRGSKPEAVLVSYEEFMRLQEQDFSRRFDELVQPMTEKNAGYTEDEVMNEVKAAIQEVREQYRE
jgi:prevent-host-death family protein